MGVAMTSSLRRSATGVGLAGGALVAAALIAPTAYADAYDDLLGQADANLTQGLQALDQVPTSALDAHQLVGLQGAETLETDLIQQLPGIETFQDGLLAADQNSPLLLDADQQFLNASQTAFIADQGFYAVVETGDLNSLSGWLDAQLPFSESAAALYGGLLDLEFTDLVAQFDPSILTAF
jgi:hypothetical protein